MAARKRSRGQQAGPRRASPGGDGDTVVLVHGLWMTGFEFAVLRNRLVHDGFRVEIFPYASMHGDVTSIAANLRRRVLESPSERVHVVGHSLGGAFVYRALVDCDAPL